MATCFITAKHGFEVLNASPNYICPKEICALCPSLQPCMMRTAQLQITHHHASSCTHRKTLQCLGIFSGIPAPIIVLSSNGRFIQTSIYVQELSVKRSWDTLIPQAWKLIRENNWMACRFSDIWVRAARYACLQILCEQDKIDFHWIWIVTLGCFIKYHSFRKWSENCSFIFSTSLWAMLWNRYVLKLHALLQ